MKKYLLLTCLFFYTLCISHAALAQQFASYGTQGTIAEKLVANLNAGKFIKILYPEN
jgi:hypothetical protein